VYQGWMRVALFFIAGSAWAGQVYRWQDMSGKWHFDDSRNAPVYAEPFVAVNPLSVIETRRPVAFEHAVSADKRKKPSKTRDHKAKERAEGAPSINIDDVEHHRAYCDKWRERLYKSRMGLRDHENQAAYERECILKVHW